MEGSKLHEICWRIGTKKCQQGGGGVKTSENSADVFYEWPQVLFTVDEVTKASKDIESTAYPALTA